MGIFPPPPCFGEKGLRRPFKNGSKPSEEEEKGEVQEDLSWEGTT